MADYKYKEGVVEHAEDILKRWYKKDPELLEQRIEAIKVYNAEHGTEVDPYRFLLVAHDAGVRAPDGSHKLFGADWKTSTQMTSAEINALASSVTQNGVTITDDVLAAFDKADVLIDKDNHTIKSTANNFTYSLDEMESVREPQNRMNPALENVRIDPMQISLEPVKMPEISIKRPREFEEDLGGKVTGKICFQEDKDGNCTVNTKVPLSKPLYYKNPSKNYGGNLDEYPQAQQEIFARQAMATKLINKLADGKTTAAEEAWLYANFVNPDKQFSREEMQNGLKAEDRKQMIEAVSQEKIKFKDGLSLRPTDLYMAGLVYGDPLVSHDVNLKNPKKAIDKETAKTEKKSEKEKKKKEEADKKAAEKAEKEKKKKEEADKKAAEKAEQEKKKKAEKEAKKKAGVEIEDIEVASIPLSAPITPTVKKEAKEETIDFDKLAKKIEKAELAELEDSYKDAKKDAKAAAKTARHAIKDDDHDNVKSTGDAFLTADAIKHSTEKDYTDRKDDEARKARREEIKKVLLAQKDLADKGFSQTKGMTPEELLEWYRNSIEKVNNTIDNKTQTKEQEKQPKTPISPHHDSGMEMA